jgi:hypothetical protein
MKGMKCAQYQVWLQHLRPSWAANVYLSAQRVVTDSIFWVIGKHGFATRGLAAQAKVD